MNSFYHSVGKQTRQAPNDIRHCGIFTNFKIMIIFTKPRIEIIQGDCMLGMAEMKDNAFDLAIVDPPYNVGASDGRFGGKSNNPSKISGKRNAKHYTNHNKTPNEKYFKELFRVSKNQIIWGSNYYPQYLYHSGAIIWDKVSDNNPVLSDCEIAFQSFNKKVNIVRLQWTGFLKGTDKVNYGERVHPNQKPVQLYKWLLKNYAKEGDTILDTHFSSASSVLACYEMGFDITAYEIDKDYYEAAKARIRLITSQSKLF